MISTRKASHRLVCVLVLISALLLHANRSIGLLFSNVGYIYLTRNIFQDEQDRSNALAHEFFLRSMIWDRVSVQSRKGLARLYASLGAYSAAAVEVCLSDSQPSNNVDTTLVGFLPVWYYVVKTCPELSAEDYRERLVYFSPIALRDRQVATLDIMPTLFQEGIWSEATYLTTLIHLSPRSVCGSLNYEPRISKRYRKQLQRLCTTCLLREHFASADITKLLATMIPGRKFELGDNLITNGDFERGESQPDEWLWYIWVDGRRFEDALFIGGLDQSALTGRRAVVIKGFWIKEGDGEKEVARAGYRSKVRLSPNAWYVLKFSYRTAFLDSRRRSIDRSVTLQLQGDQYGRPLPPISLPATGGLWRTGIAVFPGMGLHTGELMLRLWNIGVVWFDSIELRQILNPTKTLEPRIQLFDAVSCQGKSE